MFKEIAEELRTVVLGRGRWLDVLVSPIVFLLLNAWLGFEAALVGSLGVAILVAGYRLVKHQPLSYALGGVGGVILAGAIARLVGGEQGYFLPGIITSASTAILCLVSVMVRRPLAAWTSSLTRRWPLEWYWHSRVRPAYNEVTVAWAIFFALRTLLQFELFERQAADVLGWVQLISGWPALLILLVLSYLYGLWRLQHLQGPSVEEFKSGAAPPWVGQRRGF